MWRGRPGTTSPPEQEPIEELADLDIPTDSDNSNDPEKSDTPLEPATYKVAASPAFNEGCTYELTLAEGWVFVNKDRRDKPDSIRTATFSTKMAEIHNLQINSSIKYVRDGGENDPANLTLNWVCKPR